MSRAIPIIFSAPMVLALLAGRKTQTRRLAWREVDMVTTRTVDGVQTGLVVPDGQGEYRKRLPSPWQRVKPGDRLWVRENVCAVETADGHDGVSYAADDQWLPIQSTQQAAEEWVKLYHYRGCGKLGMGNPVPSIHMPRWASRLTLTVTEVRVQRLHAITEDDARAEGCWTEEAISIAAVREKVPLTAVHPSMVFWQLWNSLHDKAPARWEDNPEIVALTFTVEQRNIDAVLLEVANG